jgi:hypothetical protein
MKNCDTSFVVRQSNHQKKPGHVIFEHVILLHTAQLWHIYCVLLKLLFKLSFHAFHVYITKNT